MSRLWQWYLKNLDARPIMTKTGMTLGLMAVADTGAQVSRRNAPSTRVFICVGGNIFLSRVQCANFTASPHTALSLHLPATRSMFNTLGNVLRRCSLWLPAHLCLHAEEELAFLRKRMEEKKKKKKMRKEGRIFMALTVRRLPRMRMHISLDV